MQVDAETLKGNGDELNVTNAPAVIICEQEFLLARTRYVPEPLPNTTSVHAIEPPPVVTVMGRPWLFPSGFKS